MLKASQAAQEQKALSASLALPEAQLRVLVPGGNKMTKPQLRAHVDKAVKKNMEYFTNRVARGGMYEEQKIYSEKK